MKFNFISGSMRSVKACVLTVFSLGSLGMAYATSVYAVSDLSHSFSFYGDGRFATQYLEGEKAVTNWGTLDKFDAQNANLFILLDCHSHLKYTTADIKYLRKFIKKGGAVLIMGSHDNRRQNELMNVFGAQFVKKGKGPLVATDKMPKNEGGSGIEGGNGSVLLLEKPEEWTVYIQDADGQAALAEKKEGKGRVLLASRSLAGSRPDAKDNINKDWWPLVLKKAVEGKIIAEGARLDGNGVTQLGNVKKAGVTTYHYSDYLAPYFQEMVNIDKICRPLIQKRMGVPLSEGMGSSVGLLATGDGGFSAGGAIGLAVFWGGFPEDKAGMYEFLTHEAVHSWVLPYPEVWNEPIATYVGNLVQIDGGFPEVGKATIKHNLERASRIDPTMKVYDLEGRSSVEGTTDLEGGQANDMHWGKTYWILEQMRAQDPHFLVKYFQAKRKWVKNLPAPYNIHQTVAIMSVALGKNLFPWFNAHGIKVDTAEVKIDIPLPKEVFPVETVTIFE